MHVFVVVHAIMDSPVKEQKLLMVSLHGHNHAYVTMLNYSRVIHKILNTRQSAEKLGMAG